MIDLISELLGSLISLIVAVLCQAIGRYIYKRFFKRSPKKVKGREKTTLEKVKSINIEKSQQVRKN